MKYFKNCETLEDVKKAFKAAAKVLHPDAGGNAEEFKTMMKEYETAFERFKNIHRNKDGETYEKETAESPEQFADIISKIISFEGVKIEVIGSWIWLTGNTRPYKDDIKAAGFFWSKTKTAWYYNGEEKKSKKRGHYTMDSLRAKWGTTEVENETRRRIS